MSERVPHADRLAEIKGHIAEQDERSVCPCQACVDRRWLVAELEAEQAENHERAEHVAYCEEYITELVAAARAMADAVDAFAADEGEGEEYPAPIDLKYAAVLAAVAAYRALTEEPTT
jgi:hypothetical protein